MITLKEYCFLVLLCFLFSCRKDSVETTITNPNFDPKRLVETTVSGLVLDEQGFPIQDAKVTVGAIYSSSTVTDQNGYFKFTGFATKENGVIKIEKEQFFTSYVNISTNAKDTSRVKVLLRNLGSGTQIRGIEGGKVEVKNFGSVEFEPESFLDSEGKIYKGQVKVFFRGIDPFDQNLAKYIPAEMLSINANLKVQRLQSLNITPSMIKRSSIVSLVVPGIAETMALSSLSNALSNVDFPALGRPAITVETPSWMAFPNWKLSNNFFIEIKILLTKNERFVRSANSTSSSPKSNSNSIKLAKFNRSVRID